MKKLEVGKLYKAGEAYRNVGKDFFLYSEPKMDGKHVIGEILNDEPFVVLQDDFEDKGPELTPHYNPLRVLTVNGITGYIFISSWDRRALIIVGEENN